MTSQLSAALRAAAAGIHPDEAAAGLMIGHGSFLSRSDFAVHIETAVGISDGAPMAWIDGTLSSPPSTTAASRPADPLGLGDIVGVQVQRVDGELVASEASAEPAGEELARVINPAFAVAEAMWIMSGSDDPWIYLYNERLALLPGQPAAPRGLPTVEVLGASLTLTDPRRRLVDVPPEYADDGRLMGAYGPRLRRWHGTTDQLAHVREALAADPGPGGPSYSCTTRRPTHAATRTSRARSGTDSSCATACSTCTPRCGARTCGSGSATTSSQQPSCKRTA